MNLPKQVEYIIDTLETAGFEAYAVGGCVRDYLIGNIPKDWDITTSALPEQTKKLFPHSFDTGIQHGTITAVIDNTNYEITTYRIDGSYNDFRHPSEVTFTQKIEEDLSRRDFTMNAIAYNKIRGFCDPFGGRDDINSKIIRGVGNPDKRFKEDALRMLRGIRFSAQLNFRIEETTYNSINENACLIKNISVERIRDELNKLLLSPNPDKITELKNTNLLKNILPFLEEKVYPNCEIIKTLKYLAENKNNLSNISLFYCCLLKDMTKKETETIMKSLKFDTKTLKETSVLNECLRQEIGKNPYEIRKFISKISKITFARLLEIKRAIYHENPAELIKIENTDKIFKSIIENNDPLSLKELKINGNTLMELGITNGKEIGKILNFCLEEVLKNPAANTRENLIAISLAKK